MPGTEPSSLVKAGLGGDAGDRAHRVEEVADSMIAKIVRIAVHDAELREHVERSEASPAC